LIITFDDTGEQKPSEKPFRFALDKLNLYPEEVLFVGDSFTRDIMGAKKLGMNTLRIKKPEDLKKIFELI
jgi:putative hydrolase of the HAD superfamily